MNNSDPLNLLLDILADGDAVTQAEAARLLGEARCREAVPALLEYVDRSHNFHKSAGFTALGRIGDRSVADRIHQLIDDPRMRDDWYWFGWKSVRAAASHALLLLGDARGAAFLRQLADDGNDVFFSWFAPSILLLADELPEITELKTCLTVARLFTVPDNSTRLTDVSRLVPVLDALGWLGGPEAEEKLAGYLDHLSRFVRGQAITSLVRCGGSEKYGSLARQMAGADSTCFVRARAATAMKDTALLEQLVHSDEPPFERAAALEGLGETGDSSSIAFVAMAMEDADPFVRQCALEALERLACPELHELAGRALEDPSHGVRRQAAKALLAGRGGN